jgi:hypothetical protein
MSGQLHKIQVFVDGFDEPLVLHGGFDGYDDPYQALAEYGLFKGEHSGDIQIGDANLKIRFRTEPHR